MISDYRRQTVFEKAAYIFYGSCLVIFYSASHPLDNYPGNTFGVKHNHKFFIFLKESTEVDKLKKSLAVARRLPQQWCKIDTVVLRAFFKDARKIDRENMQKALKARAVAPILERVAKLSAEERALLLASLQ